jgi:hypothetical protein
MFIAAVLFNRTQEAAIQLCQCLGTALRARCYAPCTRTRKITQSHVSVGDDIVHVAVH